MPASSKIPVFLIGGGWDSTVIKDTYGAFIKRAGTHGRRKIVIILVTDDPEETKQTERKYNQLFKACGLTESEMQFCWGSASKPLQLSTLVKHEPTGLFVGGGSTPLYHELLCKDLSWLDYLVENQIPYAGFSAGAAIASENAVLGGWKVLRDHREIEILDEELSEGLDLLDVKPGLGLIPFSVDVHASQWGTVTRLMQALDLVLAPSGWAIDENTMLQVDKNIITVSGRGQVYHLQRKSKDTTLIKTYRSGTRIEIQ